MFNVVVHLRPTEVVGDTDWQQKNRLGLPAQYEQTWEYQPIWYMGYDKAVWKLSISFWNTGVALVRYETIASFLVINMFLQISSERLLHHNTTPGSKVIEENIMSNISDDPTSRANLSFMSTSLYCGTINSCDRRVIASVSRPRYVYRSGATVCGMPVSTAP